MWYNRLRKRRVRLDKIMKWFELKVGQMYYPTGCLEISNNAFIITSISGNTACVRYLHDMKIYKTFFTDIVEFQQVSTEEANLIKMKKL